MRMNIKDIITISRRQRKDTLGEWSVSKKGACIFNKFQF